MYASTSSSTSSSPTFNSFTSSSTGLATFDVSTHGEGPFPKPLIREDSWNRIPLEYRPLTPQPGGRFKRSSHRDVPAEYRSGGVRSPRRQQSAEEDSGGSDQRPDQRRDHRRGTLSTSSGNSGSDKTSWLAALVSTVKRPKHNRRETPPSINISPDGTQAVITASPLPSPSLMTATATATAATITTGGTTTTYLAPPPSTTAPSHVDSVIWDPTTQVWRRLLPSPTFTTSTSSPSSSFSSTTSSRSNSSSSSSSSNSGSNNRSRNHQPAASFPYSDYTLMTESERLDYFLDHRVASVVDNDDASFRASYEEGSEGGSVGGSNGASASRREADPPPPPYVQSQWEAVQERRMRRMQRSV